MTCNVFRILLRGSEIIKTDTKYATRSTHPSIHPSIPVKTSWRRMPDIPEVVVLFFYFHLIVCVLLLCFHLIVCPSFILCCVTCIRAINYVFYISSLVENSDHLHWLCQHRRGDKFEEVLDTRTCAIFLGNYSSI